MLAELLETNPLVIKMTETLMRKQKAQLSHFTSHKLDRVGHELDGLLDSVYSVPVLHIQTACVYTISIAIRNRE